MTITITAFERSPDGGKGLARDTRVRWALEEVGQPYAVRLVSFRAMKEPAHLRVHPFGQIPTYEEGDLVLFETGAIVFHIAERHAGLLPDDANARREDEVYSDLARRWSRIAKQVQDAAAQMAAQRDLPMGAHDESAWGDAHHGAFAKFVTSQSHLLALLRVAAERDEQMLASMTARA